MRRRATGICKAIALIWLAAAILFRGTAVPSLAAPPSDGLVPICLGSEIVYVALEDYRGPTLPPEEPARDADPCPWLGLTALLLSADPDPASWAARPSDAAPIGNTSLIHLRAGDWTHRARAPPGV